MRRLYSKVDRQFAGFYGGSKIKCLLNTPQPKADFQWILFWKQSGSGLES
ncbi:hypothetical protein D1AOALGA4SA_12330 [Olavius algarvensis Delta 1 endosymbiont]|nr:hypothetical protein D1AOALGA4SA_12330 [Olavius algarvensis Delta 1 endosymbiont]